MPKRTPNRGPCSIDECDKDAWSRGWCHMHYQRWHKHGDPNIVTPKKVRPKCSIEGCERLHNSHGLCDMHGRRLRKFGTTDDPRRPITERFWSKVNKNGPVYLDLGPCWEWTSALRDDGYGVFHLDGGTVRAHRWSFEQSNGAITDEMMLDHICGNRKCVNPDHLRESTAKQNTENWTRMKVDNKTGYRGVYFNGNRDLAQVTDGWKTYHLGSFSTAEEAGEVARRGRLEMHTYNDRDDIDPAA